MKRTSLLTSHLVRAVDSRQNLIPETSKSQSEKSNLKELCTGSKFLAVLFATIFFYAANSCGQTGASFLAIPNSPEGNGMGGVEASLVSDDAISTISNPAQLGIFGLNDFFSASTYTQKTALYPGWGIPWTLDATAFNGGANLKKYLGIPLPVSIGIGYSRIHYVAGTSNVNASDKTDNLSFGIGIDYGVKLSLGYTFKWIDSDLGTVWSGPDSILGRLAAKLPGRDYGVMVQVPVMELFSDALDKSIELNDTMTPMFDLTFGYARRNEGSEVNYGYGIFEALPRQGVLGWSFEIGLESELKKKPWKLLTFTWGREAEAMLASYGFTTEISPTGDTTYSGNISYRSGLGGIKPFDNLILGKDFGSVYHQTGWQIQFAECLFIRGGSYNSPLGGEFSYSTHGESFELNGFLRLLESLNVVSFDSNWFSYLIDHFDLQYHYSHYSGSSDVFYDGTTFKAINLVVK
jgi:hypothetical protein